MIPRLPPGAPFPPVTRALRGPYNGLLAATLDLTPERLYEGYLRGIFPWYSPGEPVLWWTPDPRMVLPTAQFHRTRSLRRAERAAAADPAVEIRLDRDFEAVIAACARPRAGQTGTWITPEVKAAYTALHRQDHAHSIEMYRDQRLVGGLYGVSIGRMFYGESMFAREPDASKIALSALVQILLAESVPMIDCQQNTSHLASLGAREIPRASFCEHLRSVTGLTSPDWSLWRGRNLTSLFAPAPEARASTNPDDPAPR